MKRLINRVVSIPRYTWFLVDEFQKPDSTWHQIRRYSSRQAATAFIAYRTTPAGDRVFRIREVL